MGLPTLIYCMLTSFHVIELALHFPLWIKKFNNLLLSLHPFPCRWVVSQRASFTLCPRPCSPPHFSPSNNNPRHPRMWRTSSAQSAGRRYNIIITTASCTQPCNSKNLSCCELFMNMRFLSAPVDMKWWTVLFPFHLISRVLPRQIWRQSGWAWLVQSLWPH